MKRSTILSWIFLAFLVFITPHVYGGSGTWSRRIELTDLSTTSPANAYLLTEPSLVGAVMTHQAYQGRFVLDYDREGQSDLNISGWGFASWRVSVTFDLKKINDETVLTDQKLTVAYENGNYIYSDYSAFNLTEAGYKIIVKKIESWRGTGGTAATPTNIFNQPLISNELHVRLELDAEKGFELLETEQSRMYFEASAQTMHWSYIEGAEWYDLEWVYLDLKSKEYADLSTASSAFTPFGQSLSIVEQAFLAKEPSRVRVRGNSYRLDMTYPAGIVCFRVRAVGLFSGSAYGGMTDQVKTANWNYYRDPASSNKRWIFSMPGGFENNKNWSYAIDYAENGKSVSNLSYYDGSLRGRQQISYNTSDNISLVGETKFDYEGRQVVSVLPAPVKGRNFAYRTNFNRAAPGGDPFDEDNFDKPSPDELFSPTTGEGGAAQYFSANNQFTDDLFFNTIPKSDGYVYSQTVYRNDGSGRVEKVGGIGQEFAVDGTHAVQMYYASPNPTELRRLFGENVPQELNGYRKEIVKDANGQLSITFYDKRGQVIATGLSGNSPTNLLPVQSDGPQMIQGSLLGNNALTEDGLSVVAEGTVFNEVANNLVTFQYDIGAALQQAGAICFTCAYTLEVEISGPGNTPVAVTGLGTPVNNIYTLDIDQPNPTGCSDAGNFDNFAAVNFTATFGAIGEYRIIKRLIVDTETMDAEMSEQVLAGLGSIGDFVAEYTSNLDYSACYENCSDLSVAMAKYLYTQNPSVAGVPYWASLSAAQQQTFIDVQRAIYCSTDGMEDPDADDPQDDMSYTGALCAGAREQMYVQMRPGGVYFESDATSDFWTSVGIGIADASLHIDLYPAYLPNGTGTGTRITSVSYLRNAANFQEAWLPVILRYHREWCHWYTCTTLAASNDFDNQLAAQVESLLSNGQLSSLNLTTLFSLDPFTSMPQNSGGQLQAALNNYNASGHDLIDFITGAGGDMAALNAATDPDYTGDAYDRMSILLFVGRYVGKKQQLIDAWKGTSCVYYADENAIFMPSQFSETAMLDHLTEEMADWTSSDCPQQAVVTVNSWMGQLPATCLQSLTTASPALYVAPANQLTGLYTLAELQTAGIPQRLEQLLFAYAMSHCGDQLMTPFYNDSSAYYNAIDAMLQQSCGIDTITFETAPPAGTAVMMVNQHLGGCFEEVLEAINLHLLPYTGTPTTHTVSAGSIPCYPNGGSITINNADLTLGIAGGCKLLIYPSTSPTATAYPAGMLASVESPVKILSGSQPWLRVHYTLTNGFQGYGYINPTGFCMNLGDWDTYELDPFDLGTNLTEPTFWKTDCMQSVYEQGVIDGTNAYWQMYREQLAEVKGHYRACLDVPETFTAAYKIHQYQFTLYYYDLAGNLVQTVPPQGVVPLPLNTSGQFTSLPGANPQHTLITRYAYNGMNTLTAQYTPDGGRTNFYLDKLYRVRFSRNARQSDPALPNDQRASYTKYDVLGRVTEAGEVRIGNVDLNTKVEDNTYPLTGILDYTRTLYEEGYFPTLSTIPAVFDGGVQQNLRNAIGAVVHYQAEYDATAAASAIAGTQVVTILSYSYDPHKNVKQLVSSNSQLEGLKQEHKTVRYSYDLISGNVNEVNYQRGLADEYRHRYHYDANNRLVRAFTSKNGQVWELDAKYFYYLHGTLARVETGHDKVQGTDYAYTLLGWLKGVNSGTLVGGRDIGKDGDMTGLNKYTGLDAIGFQLGYYSGDYVPIVNPAENLRPFATTTTLIAANGAQGNLYNGNITHMVTAIRKTDESVLDILGNNYKYDQLQRIRESNPNYASGLLANNSFAGTTLYNLSAGQGSYQESYTYDKNGNLSSLKRNGSGRNSSGVFNAALLPMDNMAYSYEGSADDDPAEYTNRLRMVAEGVFNSSYATDIKENQAANNYQYDKTGQLIKDLQEGIDKIEWTVTGKVKNIKFTTDAKSKGRRDLRFIYDPMDRRVAKVKYENDAHDWITYTYYSYDASGNVMATYEREIKKKSGSTFDDKFNLAEHTIYGNKRLGTENEHIQLASRTFNMTGDAETGTPGTAGAVTTPVYEYTYRKVGDKSYELSNHLGNVLSVVTDRKLPRLETAIYQNNFSTSLAPFEAFSAGTVSLSAGRLKADNIAPYGYVFAYVNTVPGRTYELSFKIDLNGQGNVQDMVTPTIVYSSNGTYSQTFTATSTFFYFFFQSTGAGNRTFYLDDVAIKEVTGYLPDVVSYADYSPFGVQLDGRFGSAGDQYRYGFNGMEKDDEVSGEGNSYTAEFWQYDSRIGRRWNIDPIVKFHESPYAAFANNPIWFADKNGADTSIVDSQGKLIEKRISDGSNVLQMRILNEDGTMWDWELSTNDFNDRKDKNNVWQDDLSRLKDAKIGDQILYFISDQIMNHIMYGSEIGLQEGPFKYAYDNSNGTMDFSSILLNNFYQNSVPNGMTDEQMDAQPLFFFFGSNSEFISTITHNRDGSDLLYNLMDAGNYLWGQAAYRIGLSSGQVHFGSNMNEFWSGGDSEADQRAISAGYSHRVSTANYIIDDLFIGLHMHMYMDYDTGKEYITFPKVLWPNETKYFGGTILYKDHNSDNK